MCIDDRRNRVNDIEIADTPRVEREHRLLVGRIEHRGVRAALPSYPLRELHCREGHGIERLERPVARGGPVERHPHPRHPVRPVQPERDGQPHVGRRALRDRRAVDEFDHRVHDGLRVHGHLDAIVGYVEQVVGFDDFEPLVHEGRRIGRDDEAHVPGRVRQCFARRDIPQ